MNDGSVAEAFNQLLTAGLLMRRFWFVLATRVPSRRGKIALNSGRWISRTGLSTSRVNILCHNGGVHNQPAANRGPALGRSHFCVLASSRFVDLCFPTKHSLIGHLYPPLTLVPMSPSAIPHSTASDHFKDDLNLSILGLGVEYPPVRNGPEGLEIIANRHCPESTA